MISAERQAEGKRERVELLRARYGDEHPEVVAWDRHMVTVSEAVVVASVTDADEEEESELDE